MRTIAIVLGVLVLMGSTALAESDTFHGSAWDWCSATSCPRSHTCAAARHDAHLSWPHEGWYCTLVKEDPCTCEEENVGQPTRSITCKVDLHVDCKRID